MRLWRLDLTSLLLTLRRSGDDSFIRLLLVLKIGENGEKNLVKAVFMSVYRGLAANSIQNQMKKGRCPKTFWPRL